MLRKFIVLSPCFLSSPSWAIHFTPYLTGKILRSHIPMIAMVICASVLEMPTACAASESDDLRHQKRVVSTPGGIAFENLPDKISEAQYRKRLKEKYRVGFGESGKILVDYVKYLESGNPAQGMRFITGLKKLALKKKRKIRTPELAFFEGSMEACWPAGFIPTRPECTQSLGTLTANNLPRLIKRGDKAALEFLALYRMLCSTDGAESENYQEFVDRYGTDKQTAARLARIRRANRHLLTLP